MSDSWTPPNDPQPSWFVKVLRWMLWFVGFQILMPNSAKRKYGGPLKWSEHKCDDGSTYYEAEAGFSEALTVWYNPGEQKPWQACYTTEIGDFSTREEAERACIEAARAYHAELSDEADDVVMWLGSLLTPLRGN